MIARARLVPGAIAALLVSSAIPAGAVAPHLRRIGGAVHFPIEAAPAAGARAPLRPTVDVTGAVPAARAVAWADFQADAGAWSATWDRATGVPSRLWGGSIAAPGASASPGQAEAIARWFVERHLALLAPGVALADLELVANHWDGRIRSIGFAQRHRGLRVVGGQLSVRFLNDRLYLVSSQILPDVTVADVATVAADLTERARAATVIDLDLSPTRTRAAAATALVIVPLVSDDAVLGYRVAAPVDVDGGSAGAWRIYADPRDGAPLVRRDLRSWASGTLLYDTPVRWPGGGRADYPATSAHVTVDGLDVISGSDGSVFWGDDQPAPLLTAVIGDLVAVQAGGDPDAAEATADLTVPPAGVARWSEGATDTLDAQLTTFVHVQVAKAYARTILTDPDALAFVNAQMVATVNIDDQCNAFYSGDAVNFFVASSQCENTGRLADVIYHEFGHGVHDNSVIEGVGLFDSAMSEGASDFFAGLITGDHEMGLGFFFDGEPLRDLDPAGAEAVWPDDVGEVHDTGLIFGGAFWDLRTALIAALGDAPGQALTEQLFVAALQRATDIPSSLIEVLATDDDDGDLGNGTPHECLIREAFGRHGLRSATAAVDAPGRVAGTSGETAAEVVVTVGGLSELCLGDEVDHVEVVWRPRFDATSPEAGTTTAAPQGGGTYLASIPLPDPGEVVEYHARVVFSDGSALQFPDNAGDPEFELYRGEVVELYCTDFETDPFDEGWEHGASARADRWGWGAPAGLGGDPPAAYSGAGVVGMTLDGDGLYEHDSASWLRSPVIDLERYSDVRLHYRRWLGVEDGFYDDARIMADDEVAWRNFDSGQSLDASRHTRDHEWVFRDVPLSAHVVDGDVQLTFDLTSDLGLELGGWTIDDLCIVADPDAICGDGTINGAEQCDAGDDNADRPDVCRVNCRRPACGDGIVDDLEACDDGNLIDDATCDRDCTPPGPDDGGCCSTADDSAGALAPLALFGLVVLGLRRRRS